MKTIKTNGISYIQALDGTDEWYYGRDDAYSDLFEAQELFNDGKDIKGSDLCLIHYPEGEVYHPLPKKEGTCMGDPVYLEDKIFILHVDFNACVMRIFAFDCKSLETEMIVGMLLDEVKDLYNVMLHVRPLCLTRQGGEGLFEIIWPERITFEMGPHETFFLRDGDRLYFNKWNETGEGDHYRYWEETFIRDLKGEIIEALPGDVLRMPDGELWHLE